MTSWKSLFFALVATVMLTGGAVGLTSAAWITGAQNSNKKPQATARPITIPVALKVRANPEPEIQLLDLNISEDGDPQTILSIRAIVTNSPITIAILIQDDIVSSASNEIKPLAEFIRGLPPGSRVMVGYIKTGSLQVRQKFTSDLDKAARSLRVPLGVASAGPYNPYVEVIEAISRFESQPSGRRSILLISDGLDISRGVDSSTPGQSVDLQRAINEAQRRSIAVYSFFEPTVTLNQSGSLVLTGNAQSSLQRLSDETGGKAYFQGTGAPVSFAPFIKDLNVTLEKQLAVTFLSTHPNKGFHKIQIRSVTPGIQLSYPTGYIR